MAEPRNIYQAVLRATEWAALAGSTVCGFAFFLGFDIGSSRLPSEPTGAALFLVWAVAGVLSRVPQNG